jgi:serine O-acetyltransferase
MKNLITEILERNKKESTSFPDKFLADEFIDKLFSLLFVSGSVKLKSTEGLKREFKKLESDFFELVLTGGTDKEMAKDLTAGFVEGLSGIYKSAMLDAKAILAFDPAARSLDEVLHVYPGFYAIAVHRISHFLWLKNQTSLARLFSEKAHCKTGIDIHPGATIGKAFAIDHGTGIVIGETTVLGDRVKIYQGVTLGALTVSKGNASKKRHPTIEDDVIIYSNATILGGNTTIGKESIIGGNVWLTASVPPYSMVFHQSEVKIKNNSPFAEPINFNI